MSMPRPYCPGQIYKVPMIDGSIYYYIADMVTRQRVMHGDVLNFRIYRMLYNNKYGFVYKPEEIQHVEYSTLQQRLTGGTCIRNIKPKLNYEEFVDLLTEQPKRISITSGISMLILNLILLTIWAILNHG